MFNPKNAVHYQLSSGLIKAPYKIALVVDTHDIDPEQILKELNDSSPDVIAIAGDIVKGKGDFQVSSSYLSQFKNTVQLLNACSSITNVYFTLGNHEWFLMPNDLKCIEQIGVTVLDNKWIKTGDLTIGGLSSADATRYWEFRSQYKGEYSSQRSLRQLFIQSKTYNERKIPSYEWLHEFEEQEGFKVLLCHHPEYWALQEPYLKDHHIDLVLSGHAHGGQIRIGNHGLFAPGQGWLPKYTSGVHHGLYGQMIISCGLANTSWVPRVHNSTEIVYIDIVPGR